MAQHEVNLGTRVTSRDGKKLGVIEKLIVHPASYRVDGFILGKGFLADEKIVTVGSGQVARHRRERRRDGDGCQGRRSAADGDPRTAPQGFRTDFLWRGLQSG